MTSDVARQSDCSDPFYEQMWRGIAYHRSILSPALLDTFEAYLGGKISPKADLEEKKFSSTQSNISTYQHQFISLGVSSFYICDKFVSYLLVNLSFESSQVSPFMKRKCLDSSSKFHSARAKKITKSAFLFHQSNIIILGPPKHVLYLV